MRGNDPETDGDTMASGPSEHHIQPSTWSSATTSNFLPSQHPGQLSSSNETVYIDLLAKVLNRESASPTLQIIDGSPEEALGKALAGLDRRTELRRLVSDYIQSTPPPGVLLDHLVRWLQGQSELAKLESLLAHDHHSDPKLAAIARLRDFFPYVTQWILSSAPEGAHPSSALQLALASRANVNMLLLQCSTQASHLGLYAMEHGAAYVASIAASVDEAQAARAIREAVSFTGPSIVLAYLAPSSLETRMAVESGRWPLYRFGGHQLEIESEQIKASLQAFIDRRSHLSLLASSLPECLVEQSVGTKEREARQARARDAYARLLSGFSQTDERKILVLYASDGGTAERLARKFHARLVRLGLTKAQVVVMDNYGDREEESELVFFTSTAGQGELPMNGRQFWKRLKAETGRVLVDKLRFSVFGLGDSHYWPRPQDASYYNKAAKDLDKRIEELGGLRLLSLGLGDEQGPDGVLTAYKDWERGWLKTMGIEAGEEVQEPADEPITNEHIKLASDFLRGTITEGLEDLSTGALAPSDGHGIYQQDDRDVREERQATGLEPAYSFMVRCRLPAGVCSPAQWLMVDDLSSTKGNGTFKLTTRQTFQFHGVVKRNLKGLIQCINQALMDTLAACGDVNRTVMCSPNPAQACVHREVHALAEQISRHLLPKTSAYGEIWLDKKLVASAGTFEEEDEEPIYGPTYLPRKFKVAIAVPPDNDVDVFAHDVGLVTIVEAERVVGYNVCVGGGMGVTHSNEATYPRLSDLIAFVRPEEVVEVIEKIVLVQRDHGNRTDRKQARLKYTVDRLGLARFKRELESRLGRKLEDAPRQFEFESNVDRLGWSRTDDGFEMFTLFIENGRVEDRPNRPVKSGLREIARVHKGTFRLTPNQHLMICDS